MSVPYEQAVDQLSSMFPTYDRGVLSELLALNGHHIERTIETVLAMEGQVELPSSTIAAQQPRVTAQPSPAELPHQPTVVNYRHEGGYGQASDYGSDAFNSSFGGPGTAAPRQEVRAPQNVRVVQQHTLSSGNYGKAGYRGTRCQLPPDFLRVPYSADPAIDETILADEQLAIMLQNELFQREAFNALGEDYTGPRPPVAGQGGGIAATQSSGSGDLGILKGLSSMGAAAKKRLSQLALKYKSTNPGSYNVDDNGNTVPYTPSTTSALHATRDGDGDTEMSSLLSQPGRGSTPSKGLYSASQSNSNPIRSSADGKSLLSNDDDDDAEEINFSSGGHTSHRGSHSLDSSNANFNYRSK